MAGGEKNDEFSVPVGRIFRFWICSGRGSGSARLGTPRRTVRYLEIVTRFDRGNGSGAGRKTDRRFTSFFPPQSFSASFPASRAGAIGKFPTVAAGLVRDVSQHSYV